MSLKQMKPEELTQFLNFEYYLVSSPREHEVFSPQPEYLDPTVFHKMLSSGSVLYKLVERIVKEYLIQPSLHQTLLLPDFLFRQEILDLPIELPPFFWARYDAFEREQGGIFFSEFNYDKPCAQREIIISDVMNPTGNPNQGFAEKFRQGIKSLWQTYGNGSERPNVGILVDPNHYDETHLAFLYADLLKPFGYQCTILGGHNVKVKREQLSAFGKPLDIILRQYPGEFAYEVNDYSGLLDLIARRKVLVLNDPRAIVPQAKSLFAYLWELLEKRSSWLTQDEARAIRDTIPYTRIFDPGYCDQLLAEREHWVLKSVFGRYSESVYIGAMMNDREWQEVLEYVIESDQAHVMQEFVPIKRQVVPHFNGVAYENRVAFGNYGIYFTCGQFSGTCVRWSTDYLSLDDTVWFTPVGIKNNYLSPITIRPWTSDQRKRRGTWQDIACEAAFRYSYTTSHTGEYESFAIEPVVLSQAIYNELVAATESIARVFLKTRGLLCDKLKLFGPLLGIPDSLYPLIKNDSSQWLSFISRFDWAIDRNGQLRLLELNADTPAGLEAYGLNHLAQKYYPGCKDPNEQLPRIIAEKFAQVIKQHNKKIKSLGLVALASAEEDWANLLQIGDFLAPVVDKLLYGDISGLTCRKGELLLYGQPLDALYRYYPLDWLAQEKRNRLLIPGLDRVCMINPPSALIIQSKAFMAVVWQLMQEGFYSIKEQELIKRYLVPTFLEGQGKPCIIKPFLEREGQGVVFSHSLKTDDISKLADQNVVYQDLVDIYPIAIDVNSSYGKRYQATYPILGAFLIGDKFGGIYTRLGSRITDRYAVVVPTFIEE